MILQRLSWNADLSAFTLWVVSGFMIATSALNLAPAVKGMVMSFLCLLPSLFIIGAEEPLSLLPIGAMTLLLGSLLGFTFDRLSRRAA